MAVAVAIVGVMVGLGAPILNGAVREQRSVGTARRVMTDLRATRGDALSGGGGFGEIASASGPAGGGGGVPRMARPPARLPGPRGLGGGGAGSLIGGGGGAGAVPGAPAPITRYPFAGFIVNGPQAYTTFIDEDNIPNNGNEVITNVVDFSSDAPSLAITEPDPNTEIRFTSDGTRELGTPPRVRLHDSTANKDYDINIPLAGIAGLQN